MAINIFLYINKNMSSFIFDYDTFYSYYNDNANLLIDNAPQDIYYFIRQQGSNKLGPRKTKTSNYYITISNGNKLYVSQLVNGDILFTILNDINGVLYADHYHFGLQNKYENITSSKSKIISTIFFHKTIQVPSTIPKNGGKYTKNCWFEDGISITDIKDIICMQEKSATMAKNFPFPSTFTLDIEFIQEIISRPFLGILNQGGAYKYTVKNLKELAKKRKIVGYSKLNKKDLIKLLKLKTK
jgi:hypothetical protein